MKRKRSRLSWKWKLKLYSRFLRMYLIRVRETEKAMGGEIQAC